MRQDVRRRSAPRLDESPLEAPSLDPLRLKSLLDVGLLTGKHLHFIHCGASSSPGNVGHVAIGNDDGSATEGHTSI
jgi:hypothetical protein